jgi:hypothetical protein
VGPRGGAQGRRGHAPRRAPLRPAPPPQAPLLCTASSGPRHPSHQIPGVPRIFATVNGVHLEPPSESSRREAGQARGGGGGLGGRANGRARHLSACRAWKEPAEPAVARACAGAAGAPQPGDSHAPPPAPPHPAHPLTAAQADAAARSLPAHERAAVPQLLSAESLAALRAEQRGAERRRREAEAGGGGGGGSGPVLPTSARFRRNKAKVRPGPH